MELQRFVAVLGVIFGGMESKNVCGTCNTLLSSLFEPSKHHQSSYSNVWETLSHCIPKDNLEICNFGIGEEGTSKRKKRETEL